MRVMEEVSQPGTTAPRTGCWCGWEASGRDGRETLALFVAHMAGHRGEQGKRTPGSLLTSLLPRRRAAACPHCGKRPNDAPFPEDQCPRCEPAFGITEVGDD